MLEENVKEEQDVGWMGVIELLFGRELVFEICLCDVLCWDNACAHYPVFHGFPF